MHRHYITSIDYKALIERQANTPTGEIKSKKGYRLNRSKKHQIKSQNKSKVLVRKMNMGIK